MDARMRIRLFLSGSLGSRQQAEESGPVRLRPGGGTEYRWLALRVLLIVVVAYVCFVHV